MARAPEWVAPDLAPSDRVRGEGARGVRVLRGLGQRGAPDLRPTVFAPLQPRSYLRDVLRMSSSPKKTQRQGLLRLPLEGGGAGRSWSRMVSVLSGICKGFLFRTKT